MPAKKASRISQTEYLLDAVRHIEAVARATINAIESGGPYPRLPPPYGGGGCFAPPSVLPRPFGRGCGAMVDIVHEAGDRAVAGGPPRKARRSRKPVRR
jgi:hypothetical protein